MQVWWKMQQNVAAVLKVWVSQSKPQKSVNPYNYITVLLLPIVNELTFRPMPQAHLNNYHKWASSRENLSLGFPSR